MLYVLHDGVSEHMIILVAEDDIDVADGHKMALESRGHEVIITHDGEKCLEEYEKKFTEWSSSKHGYRTSPFDAVLLDYKMPKKNGMQVAADILAINPKERIIFVSAYVHETLEESVKQLHQVVELMQKPFDKKTLVESVEDTEIYVGLQKLNADLQLIKGMKLTHLQLRGILDGLRKLQKGRTF